MSDLRVHLLDEVQEETHLQQAGPWNSSPKKQRKIHRRRDVEEDINATWRLKMLTQKSMNKFMAMFMMSFLYFIAEMGIGAYSGSLALIADAFHILTDVVALSIGYYAAKVSRPSHSITEDILWTQCEPQSFSPICIVAAKFLRPLDNFAHTLHGATQVSSRGSTAEMSFGWKRAEIVGALANGCFLLAVVITIALEAVSNLAFVHVYICTLHVRTHFYAFTCMYTYKAIWMEADSSHHDHQVERLCGLSQTNPEQLEGGAITIIITGAVGLAMNLFGMCIFGGHSHGMCLDNLRVWCACSKEHMEHFEHEHVSSPIVCHISPDFAISHAYTHVLATLICPDQQSFRVVYMYVCT